MLIGYARVSLRLKQDEAPQVAALERAGCERVFRDRVSRLRDDRPGLTDALSHLRPGDVLVVWRMDRAVSGMRQAVNLLESLKAAGCGLVSITEGIDTRTPLGEALFTIVAALSQIEVQANKERTLEKLAHVRSRGTRLGAKPKLSDQDVRDAELLLQDGSRSVEEVAARFGVSRWTLNRARNRVQGQNAVQVGPENVK